MNFILYVTFDLTSMVNDGVIIQFKMCIEILEIFHKQSKSKVAPQIQRFITQNVINVPIQNKLSCRDIMMKF